MVEFNLLALQQSNTPDAHPNEEARLPEGWVTVRHTSELLRAMHNISPSDSKVKADRRSDWICFSDGN